MPGTPPGRPPPGPDAGGVPPALVVGPELAGPGGRPADAGGAPAGREGGRPPGGVDAGRLDGLDDDEPGTLGVLGPREDPPGEDDRDGVEPPELPDTLGVPGPREPADEEDDPVGDEPFEPLFTRGPGLPRSEPAWRTLDAADWSVARASAAVARTFWPVDSDAAAAFSVPSRAVLIASSALTIATWPNTPALWDDAPMFSLPPTPSRIWLPRLLMRLPTLSTPSGSMLEPLPGAIPPEPPEPVEPDEPDEPEEPLW